MSGWIGGLENACRALQLLEVDIAVLQETKLAGGIHTRSSSRYKIAASNTTSDHSRWVALCWQKHDIFKIKERKLWGANVLTF